MAHVMHPGDIYVATFSRRAGVDRLWMIVVFEGNNTFTKYHAACSFSQAWSYQTGTNNVLASLNLGTMNKIGSLVNSGCTTHDLQTIFSAIELRTPREFGGRKEPFNCRIWTLVGIRDLHGANDALAVPHGPVVWHTCVSSH
ncbi:unnamed protein product [Somion occarium]|uniref:Uncharacterized protein n=1 Tax=Somion occarium TaxID=3059160 RepID=A0ABP1E8B3_9APHY